MGRALIAVDSLDKQLDIYQQILANGLSVRDTEAIVKAEKGVDTLPRKQAKNTKLPSEIVDATKELSDTLGAKVNATVDAKGKGKLTIAFKSQKELERIIKQLNA
ncbi:chromosome (plasmid) partitioning protein ParB [Nonlabens ulvanivorans]|nr:chromosome (plasmid) partitioning protein ParB [Nonlabens ulvanivorans]